MFCSVLFVFSTAIDENGTVTRPPPVTIVLLTMHKWFVTSKELFAKVVQVYPSNKYGKQAKESGL